MKKEVLIVIAIFTIGLIGFNKLFQSDDEKLIEELIQNIQDNVTISTPLKPLEVPRRINSVKKHIIPNVKVTYNDGESERSFSAETDLKSKAAPAALYLQKLNVFRTNTMINLRGSFADAVFQAAVSGSARAGSSFSETVTVKLTLQKTDSDWLVRDVEINKLL